MDELLRRYYLDVSMYTYAGEYKEYFRSLPDDVPETGRLVCDQLIHPSFFFTPISEYMEKTYYGSLDAYQKNRFLNEDEMFITAAAMTAQLFFLDGNGFTRGNGVDKRLSVTCRGASVLMSAILKAKGIPCRSRAGFMDFGNEGKSYAEHWVNEYFDEKENRWVMLDADGYYEYEGRFGYSQFDLPKGKFIYASDAWLGVRNGTLDRSLLTVGESEPGQGLYAYLMMDFHALMNNEIFYTHMPAHLYNRYGCADDSDMHKLDELARLMYNPDENYAELHRLWETDSDFYRLSNFGTDLYGRVFGR